MFRAHRRVALGLCGSTTQTVSVRAYTPIFTAEPAVDKLAAQRLADETRALWGPTAIIPNQARAVEAWLRFGNDPVVHTTLPVDVPPELRPPGDAPIATSPFAYVEDYMGTNLVRNDRPEHLKESLALWTQYFEAKYVGRMRLSRRTATNVLGQVNAPDVLMDEADQPGTKWSQDTYFSEMGFLCERHLKEKTTTMEQLDRAIWVKSLGNVEGFLAFFDALQQQTQLRVPLPSPSVWFYEGEARQKWAAQYLPAAQAARTFVETVLAPEVARLGGGAQGATTLLQSLAKGFAEVHKVAVQRAERQAKEGLRPSYTGPAITAAEAEKREAWCANELEREERGVQEGAYDPEDMLDTSDAWKAENKSIQDLLEATLDGTSVTLKDFWLHMIRLEALETQHAIAEDHFRAIAAAARVRMYQEGDTVADIAKSLEASIAGGSLDLRAAVFRPQVRRNPIWCKLNYAKFGSSAVVHHSLAASRQLQYAYAASLAEVEAAATLYYDTKPLSTSLDYSSPYKLRTCLARLCANYELTLMRSAQMPFLASAAELSEAESTMAAVVEHVAGPFGVRRRARLSAAQKQHQRLLVPVKSVTVCEVASELLETGAADEAVQAPPRVAGGDGAPVTMWPLGARKAVRVEWPVGQLEKLRLTHQAGPMTAERATAIAELEQSARLELSLWRRLTPAEKQQGVARAEALAKRVETVVKGAPAFAEVATYARQFFATTSREPAHDAAAAAAEPETEWVFACMLDDNVQLTLEQAADVYLPYATTNPATGKRESLPQGEYVVRVRAYDRTVNPSELPALTTEAASAPFKVFDALPQLEGQFFHQNKTNTAATAEASSSAGVTHLRGEDLLPYCAFLREAGLDVPLHFEFAMGQSQDGQCMISMQAFLDAVRSDAFHRSRAELGVTETQRQIEPRYHAHWALYHPGATPYEWASARRRELNYAMQRERDWWLADPLLHVPDVVTGSTGSNATAVDFATIPAITRYAAESSAVLEARGVSLNASTVSASPTAPATLTAECNVDGTGAMTELSFGHGVTTTAADVPIEEALAAALSAVQHAQTRHATLAMSRTAPLQKQVQALLFCGVHGLPFGGKYARTYCYALEKAKKELNALTQVSGKSAVGLEDAEKARVSEQDKVDRYASTTHPEQRRTRFTERVTVSGQRMEDVQPNQTTSWNR